ncbi:MAG: metalloregulator ArsR/SmtB family transcription factor [bacterium]
MNGFTPPRQQKNIRQLASMFKALGHPSRLAATRALAKGERCVCELKKVIGADMSTVSNHLAILRNAGLVKDEKRGLQVFYSLKRPCMTHVLACFQKAECSCKKKKKTR